jgi:hypothetical protein
VVGHCGGVGVAISGFGLCVVREGCMWRPAYIQIGNCVVPRIDVVTVI